MRTCVTIILIIILIVSVTWGEYHAVNRACTSLEDGAKSISQNYTDPEKVKTITRKMSENWNKYKKTVFIFVNHNTFGKIDDKMTNLRYSVSIGDFEEVRKNVFLLESFVKELRAGIRFNGANVL